MGPRGSCYACVYYITTYHSPADSTSRGWGKKGAPNQNEPTPHPPKNKNNWFGDPSIPCRWAREGLAMPVSIILQHIIAQLIARVGDGGRRGIPTTMNPPTPPPTPNKIIGLGTPRCSLSMGPRGSCYVCVYYITTYHSPADTTRRGWGGEVLIRLP